MDAQTLAPIHLVIETAAPPDVAWTYITEPERVALWLTEATPLGAVGDLYRLDFGEGSVVEGVVVSLDPGRSFSHEWAWEDTSPDERTLVSWTVEPRAEGGSRVLLVHDGWAETGADEAMRDDHEAYWSGYLDDLRDLLAEAGA